MAALEGWCRFHHSPDGDHGTSLSHRDTNRRTLWSAAQQLEL